MIICWPKLLKFVICLKSQIKSHLLKSNAYQITFPNQIFCAQKSEPLRILH